MATEQIHLLFGQIPSNDFLGDLNNLKSLKKEEVFDLLDKIIEWYPRDNLEKEWKEWETKLGEEESKKRKSALQLLLFVMRELANGNVSEAEVREDFQKVNLSEEYLENIIKRLSFSDEFKKKALGKKKPFENIITDMDWRIDKRIYRNHSEETFAVIELVYDSKGKTETICFDMNLGALKQIITVLKRIEDVLCLQK